MPTYEYLCECGQGVSIFRSVKDDEKKPICAKCKVEMKRVFGLAATQFKGSGFYSTDKRNG